MAHGNITIPVPGELMAVDVNGRVVSAEGVYDYNESKSQETINAEVKEALGTGGSVDSRIAAAINALDSTKSQSAGADGLALSVTEENGKITSISGSIAANTYDSYGSASDAQSAAISAAATDATTKVNAAKTELLGDAASDYNTLGKLEDKIQAEESRAEGAESTLDSKIAAEKTRAEGVEQTLTTNLGNEVTRATDAENALDGRVDTLETAVGTGGSVDSRISSAVNAAKSEIKGTATSACDTLGEAEALISANATAISNEATARGNAVSAEAARAQAAEADRYTKSETYTKEEVNGLVDTPHQEYVTVETFAGLPATGSKDTIYRVSNYNGSTSQVDASVYSEYAWNGTQYIFLCVKSQIGEVFDISVYNNNAKYADLAAALNGGANIPQSLQKGGMSVKYVQSSDNKYVQYRLMANAWTVNTDAWSICGDDVLLDCPKYIKAITDADGRLICWINADGSIDWAVGVPSPVKEYIDGPLSDKVNKEEGKGLIQNEVSESLYVVEDAERRSEVIVDSEGKVISYRDADGVKHESVRVETEEVSAKNASLGNVIFTDGIPDQIKEYVEHYVPKEDDIDVIPYNDILSIGNKILKIYNPYKEAKSHQYTGQMHCHSWTKYSDSEYAQVDYQGEKWKVPYGYLIDEIPPGETNIEKYIRNMSHEKRVAILKALAMAYLWRHKKLGYNFMALTDYAKFGDVTKKPNLSDIEDLETNYPDAYAYFESLYLDGFDLNDFDANGNLKDFCWLSDSYETTTSTLGVTQHMVVHCAPDFSELYGSGTFKEVMDRVQDYGCISQWPHPTDNSTPATPEVIATVRKRLRLMEVWDGVSMRKYDAQGTMTNRAVVVAGVMPDEPYDDIIKQGNFTFCMAISDERPTQGRSGVSMTTINHSKNIKNGCVKVFTDSLTSEDIFNSLLTGNFYASSDSDVNINSVTIANGRYTVDVGIAGVVVEFLKEDNTVVKTVNTSAGNTVAYYDITGNEQYVRARIYKLNNLPYNADYWYYNKEWIVWTQPVFISKTIL